jgi:Fic family protein
MNTKGKYLQEILFLQESNNIENVWDADSLISAFDAWRYLRRWPKLYEEQILRAHRKLMLEKIDPTECGYWRERPVYIGGREGKPYFAIPTLIKNWIKRANNLIETYKTMNKKDVEEEIKEQHIFFENIHPFIDGNGRMGRILLNWTRVKCKLPILVIKEKEKFNYYEWFQ